jgi:hypothetical protein
MSKAIKLILQLGLAAMLLISFGAVACDASLDADGDDNLGVAVVLQARSSATQNRGENNRGPVSTAATLSRPTSFLRSVGHASTVSPLALLGSPQLIVPLRP